MYLHMSVCVCVCGDNWISDLCGLGMSRCKFIFFECPVFLEKDSDWIMNHTLQPEVRLDNGRTLQILSCNNNARTVFNSRRTVRLSFETERRGKARIKVFLEQSTVGPFADVMRRNVALMEPHYAERRFSFHRGVECARARGIYSKHMFKHRSVLRPWSHLIKSWQAGGSRVI